MVRMPLVRLVPLTLAVAVGAGALPARADLVRVGDRLTLSAALPGPGTPPAYDVARAIEPGYGGGPFLLTNTTVASEWVTFCIERGETVAHGGSYTVIAVSDRTSSGATLTSAAAWLYEQFRFGGAFDGRTDFGGSTFDRTRADHTRLLQLAMWLAMGYQDVYSDDVVNLATYAAGPGRTTTGQVRIIQLQNMLGGHAQDQLALVPVPEPGALLLIGTGLAGLAAVARHRRHCRR